MRAFLCAVLVVLSVPASAGAYSSCPPSSPPPPVPTADNPSFASDTATWSPTSPSIISRDTTVFASAPASGRWERPPWPLIPNDAIHQTFSGTFWPGTTYTFSMRIMSDVARMGVDNVFGDGTDYVKAFALTSTAWQIVTITWEPETVVSGAWLTMVVYDSFAVMGRMYIDSLRLTAVRPPPCIAH